MFTVKATYRNETRRFTFPDSVLFPTYEELHHQLYRVFPISHNYYLSRLIFSPDAFKPGRILVGKEVHSAEDYDSHVAPLRRLWPNPLLRFTIFDETPHKASMMTRTSERLSLYSAPTTSLSAASPKLQSPVVPCDDSVLPLNSQSFISPPLPPPQPLVTCMLLPPPLSTMSPPLPPPIVSSPPLSKFYPPQECGTVSTAPCCAIAKGKADVEALLSAFKEDLDGILHRVFGSAYAEKQPAASVEPLASSSDTGASSQIEKTSVGAGTGALSRWCFVCKTSFNGIWYGCGKCPWHAVCPSCFSKSHSAHTLSFGPSHVVQQRSSDYSIRVPMQTTNEDKFPDSTSGAPETTEPASPGPAHEPSSPVHNGVICDGCNSTIMGVRHKCLDCPDYDLCATCVESGATEQHNPFHEFLDIETPGRVYVHTILNGDSGRSPENRQQSSGSDHAAVTRQGSAPILPGSSICHSATCNLCDSAIVGERYKCTACPDFDTCSSCFRITTEQHPGHGFVKVNKPEDLMMRDSIPFRQVAHFALCNSCRKTIRGARYKCMHPGCPDFDLCSACEALPIPVHPLNHPLLKLKTTETDIPTVHRLGETQTTDEPIGQKSAPTCGESRSPIKSPELAPVVVPGQSMSATEEVLVPFAEEFLSPLGSPKSGTLEGVPTSVTTAPSHLLVDIASPPASPRSIHTALDVYQHLWPRANQEMMHLNVAQAPDVGDPVVNSVEDIIAEPVVPEPVVGEDSLQGAPATSTSRVDECQVMCPVSPGSGNKSVVDGYHTPTSTPSSAEESHRTTQQALGNDRLEMVDESALRQSGLDSFLVGDANVPNGQIFPPGAEFVKGWHMMNNGVLSWPTTTEIQFVAGEMFAPECSTNLRAKVGVVYPGRDLDIWTGDLKAPDTPGRYVGYWRLSDGQGKFFGSSVWIDLTVADHHSDQESEHSLAASSMVMPSAHPANLVQASGELRDAPQPSLPSLTDEVEDPESDVSSVSLVSVPTSDDEDAEWQDTRTHSEPLEYVVLYDSNSEEE